MSDKTKYQNRIELLQGTLDLLVLQTLRFGPEHGYGISQAIRARSADVLNVETGSLYPALHRLARQGWLASEWRLTDKGQRAKYYRLTPAGRKQLVAEQARWRELSSAIERLLLWRSGESEA